MFKKRIFEIGQLSDLKMADVPLYENLPIWLNKKFDFLRKMMGPCGMDRQQSRLTSDKK